MDTETTETTVKPVKPVKGRPTKAIIDSKRTGAKSGRTIMGRPTGDATRIQEFKARLLGSSGEKIINTLIAKALDVNDKDNMAAIKMCVDRILPLSSFEAVKSSGTIPQVTINITGLNDAKVRPDLDVIDV